MTFEIVEQGLAIFGALNVFALVLIGILTILDM